MEFETTRAPAGAQSRSGAVRAPQSLRAARGGLGAVLAAGLAAGLAVEAQAAGAPASSDDVVVTGSKVDRNIYADPVAPYKVDRLSSPKLPEPLLNIPKMITVIPKEVIRDTGATTFRDLMRTQSGVTLGTGEGGNAFGDRFFVRGFDTRNDVYVDGIRDPGVGSREVFAIEQVEVLKGPSATYGGRGATGAAISIVSKRPLMTDFAIVGATVGSDATHRATVDANYSFDEKLQVRINAMVHGSHVAGRDYVFNNRWGVAAAMNWRPIDTVQVKLDYYHLDTDELPDWGFPYDVTNNRPFKVERTNFYGVLARDYRDTRADIGTGRIEWTPTDMVSFSTAFRYGETLNAYIASAPEAPVTTNADPAKWTLRANPKQRDATTNTWASLTDVTLRFATGPFSHTLIAGAEFSRERVRNNQYANLNAELGGGVLVAPTTIIQNLQDPDPSQPWPFPRAINAIRTTQVDTKGVYALDTLHFGEHWQLTYGVRYDNYDISLTNQAIPGATTVLGQKNGLFNYNVGVAYKPAANGTIYFSYGTSSNPAGEQLDAAASDYGGLAANNQALDPEKNYAYEVGIKWNLLREHLSVAAAAFRIDKGYARVTVGQSVSTEGDFRVDGLEFMVNGNVTERFSLYGGLTLLNGKVLDSPLATQVSAQLPNIARTSFTMMGRYQLNDRFYVGGQANFNSRKYGGTVAAGTTFVPGYWRFDAFGGYRISDHAEFSVNILNLTDKFYYDALYRSAMPFSYAAPGASVLAKLSITF
jgi:catecholate siderophore receptor